MEPLEERFPRLLHLWLDAGYNGKGKGKDWAENVLGLSVEVVRPPRRWVWVREDQEPPPCLAGFYGLGEEMGSRANVLVDRAEPQAEQGLREAAGHERGAFVYVAMSRLRVVKRLARS